jgi:hypothetical protein
MSKYVMHTHDKNCLNTAWKIESVSLVLKVTFSKIN